MRRREFILGLGGAAAWPLAARAQQANRVRRVAILNPSAGDYLKREIDVLHQALQSLGWRDGANVRIDYRADEENLKAAAERLIARQPDVAFTVGAEPLQLLRERSRSMPIVFAMVSDPVGSGFVRSLARPGGNVTGFMNFEPSIAGKWIALLKEMAPHLECVMALEYPGKATWRGYEQEIEAAGRSQGIAVSTAFVRSADEIESSFTKLPRDPRCGVIVMPDIVTNNNRELIARLAAQGGLPAVYPFRMFAASGGLMSYGVDRIEIFRRAASYVDRILRGEQPSDLPVQAPTKFELVINLKTAKALGLEVPLHLQQLADEVIE
jgi:putative ABC transport system substrate-binding protein